MQEQLKGSVFAVSAGICWGSMAVAAQFLLEQGGFTAQDLVTGRLFGAGALLLALEAVRRRRQLLGYFGKPRNAADLVIYGLILTAIQLTFFLAIAYSNAATAAILVMIVPLLNLGWESLCERRLPSPRVLLCFLSAVAGVALLVTRGDFRSLDINVAGVCWGLLSAVCGSAGSFQPRRVLKEVPVTVVVGAGLTVGGLVMSFVAPIWGLRVDWTPVSAALYGYMIVFGTLIAFLLYLESLKRIRPSTASLLNSFEPLSAVFFSVILLGVAFSGMELLGTALIFIAIFALPRRGPG